MATGFGLRLVGRLGGGEPHIQRYHVPASNSGALYQGDLVKVPNTTGVMDTPGEYIDITIAADADDVVLGAIVGFKPSPALPYTGQYRAASTERYVDVCDDPYAIYEIQEDAVGGAVTAALIGALSNADAIYAAGSTVTGLSGTMLDSSTAAATALQLKILGVRQDGTNAAAATAGAVLLVRILSAQHALIATDSQL